MRRAALAALIITVASAGFVAQPQSSTDRTKELARRLDALVDQLPEEQILTSRTEMISAAVEILPYMAYEGLVSNAARMPSDIRVSFSMSASAFHVLGQAQCRSENSPRVVLINGRAVNPWSPVYGHERTLGTLVHELVHIQGGPFCSGSSNILEGYTQIATAEVLAAMVNHGNQKALRPLLLHLRNMALGSLHYQMGYEEYAAFYRTVEDDPFRIASFEKSMRRWHSTPEMKRHLDQILKRYSHAPWVLLLESIDTGFVQAIRIESSVNYRGEAQTRSLKVDDLVYFLEHAETLVRHGGIDERR